VELVQKLHEGVMFVSSGSVPAKSRLMVRVAVLFCLTMVAVANISVAQPIQVIVNGSPVALRAQPSVINDQLYLPLRELFGILGVHVTWIPQAQTIVAYRDQDVFVLRVGSEAAEVNGTELILSHSPAMIEGAVFVPLRAVASLLGASVIYTNRTVDILITPMDGPNRAPSAYAATIDRCTRQGFKGATVWLKCFRGPVELPVYELGKKAGTLSASNLSKFTIVEITASNDTDANPRPSSERDRLVGLQDSKGLVGWLEIYDFQSGYGRAFDYEGTLGKYFYMSDPFRDHKWSKDTWDLIRTNRIRIGMSPDMVRMSWGDPEDINRTIYTFGVHEQWVYGIGCYVYFEDGKVTAIQN
jgi:hypothetical protein